MYESHCPSTHLKAEVRSDASEDVSALCALSLASSPMALDLASAIRRDFPMPASPTTVTTPPIPAWRRTIAAVSATNSAPRPTNGTRSPPTACSAGVGTAATGLYSRTTVSRLVSATSPSRVHANCSATCR